MKTIQIYLSDKQALAYFREQATAEFWDKHWSAADLQNLLRSSRDDGLFVPLVKKYLPAHGLVLEGGCGTGHIVHALQYQGYKAIGVDFAAETIQKIKDVAPELDVRVGDVRALNLPNASLDGYISVGVIEHFWDGYEPIVKEMYRTLKVGGFLFVSFPYLSPLRRLKVALHMYPFKESATLDDQQERFYQFALTAGKVQTNLESLGFQLKEQLTYDGIKGFKDEVAVFKPYLQQIYDGKRGQRWSGRLNRSLLSFASHCALLVMQKT
jgi:SAM-dependent methyltransferase